MAGRCEACNVILTDFESTRKTLSGHYLDLCNRCFDPIRDQIEVIERDDLMDSEEMEEFEEIE